MSNGEFLEKADIVSGFVPVNMCTADNTGTYVNMGKYNRAVCVLFKSLSATSEDPVLKVQQATSAAGAGAKDLLFTRYRVKKALVGALGAVGQFTQVTQTAATSVTAEVEAENEALVAVEIKADDLDVNNGFKFINASVADPGNTAQLGCVFYIMVEPREAAAAMPSAIA